MKCRKCRTEMTRQKTKEHTYIYVCPKCHNTIKAKDTTETAEK